MAALEISLLGDVRLAHAGAVIRCPGEKAMLLLARLASPPGVVHRREVLQARLWPESDRGHAQGALRFLLHRLRRALGPAAPALARDAASVWLSPDPDGAMADFG
jgi:DNA-binding SARP family transcriptional activator